MKHYWIKQIVSQEENDVDTLIESMPEEILDLIELDRKIYQLFSHEQHQVDEFNMKRI